MTISSAVEAAKENGEWNIVPHEPTSVLVRFWRKNQTEDNIPDETELDLYEDDPEAELAELWESLAEEMESAPDRIAGMEAYGYID